MTDQVYEVSLMDRRYSLHSPYDQWNVTVHTRCSRLQ